MNLVRNMIVASAVISALGCSLMPVESKRPDKAGITAPGQAMARARDEKCRTQLNQLRQMIMVAQTTDDTNPTSLNELRGASSMLNCPNGNEPYIYDPASGKVKCNHPGHGKF